MLLCDVVVVVVVAALVVVVMVALPASYAGCQPFCLTVVV